MLFLRHIREIEWTSAGGSGGCYLRQAVPCGAARRVSVIGQTADREDEATWLFFELPVASDVSSGPLHIEAAFRIALDEETGKEKVVAVEGSELSVFSLYGETHRTGFCHPGTVSHHSRSRQYPKDDVWNTKLVAATADLVASTLGCLRDMRLLTVGALQTLPLRQARPSRLHVFGRSLTP